MSFMDYVYPRIPLSNVTMLTVQYRMNAEIMQFPSGEFYDGKLEADPSVKNISLNDLVKSNEIHPKCLLIDYGYKDEQHEVSVTNSPSKGNICN